LPKRGVTEGPGVKCADVTSTLPAVTSEPFIYGFIRSHLGDSGRLDGSALALPDDTKGCRARRAALGGRRT
jgi:hypothetical protein